MYFGTVDPSSKTVKVSTLDNLCSIIYEDSKPKDYITIENISFTGANEIAISGNRNNYTTIQNCSIDFSGNYGIGGVRSASLSIVNTILDHSNDCGIYLTNNCNNAVISGNTVMNSGLYPGMVWAPGSPVRQYS